MLAEELALFLQVGASPGKAQAMRLLHELIVSSPRRHECLVQAGGHPRIVLENIGLDDDWMHDRKDLGLLVVLALVFFDIGKQPLDGSITANPSFGQVWFGLRIDFSLE